MKFLASKCWFSNFIRRHKMRSCKSHGEAGLICEEDSCKWALKCSNNFLFWMSIHCKHEPDGSNISILAKQDSQSNWHEHIPKTFKGPSECISYRFLEWGQSFSDYYWAITKTKKLFQKLWCATRLWYTPLPAEKLLEKEGTEEGLSWNDAIRVLLDESNTCTRSGKLFNSHHIYQNLSKCGNSILPANMTNILQHSNFFIWKSFKAAYRKASCELCVKIRRQVGWSRRKGEVERDERSYCIWRGEHDVSRLRSAFQK